MMHNRNKADASLLAISPKSAWFPVIMFASLWMERDMEGETKTAKLSWKHIVT